MFNTNAVLAAYIIAMLWSESTDDGTPLDQYYGPADLAPDSLARLRKDVETFLARLDADGVEWWAEYEDDILGHNLHLTRNRHGCGFWEDEYMFSAALTNHAHRLGEVWPYIGDDGKVHVA